MMDEACLVCGHLAADPSSPGYVAHTNSGWAAACSRACLEAAEGQDLHMVHLGHVLGKGSIASGPGFIPKGIEAHKTAQGWTYRYFDEVAEGTEGEFIAAPPGHVLRGIGAGDVVFVYVEPGTGATLTVSLDEGLETIPFWTTSHAAKVFEDHIPDGSILVDIPYGQLREQALQVGISFLAPDFLCREIDYARLVAEDPVT